MELPPMELPLILLLEGVLFIVVFGGLSLLRREGFSGRFAIEVLAITILAAGIVWLTGYPINPIVLLVAIYLVGMRTRLLVDFGNLLARQGRFDQAERLYGWAERLWPDPAGREIIALNRATSTLFQGKLEEAAAAFRMVLTRAREERLGDKFQAAAHYNLGATYRKLGNEAQARAEFNSVVELLPISELGRAARAALAREQKNV